MRCSLALLHLHIFVTSSFCITNSFVLKQAGCLQPSSKHFHSILVKNEKEIQRTSAFFYYFCETQIIEKASIEHQLFSLLLGQNIRYVNFTFIPTMRHTHKRFSDCHVKLSVLRANSFSKLFISLKPAPPEKPLSLMPSKLRAWKAQFGNDL